MKRRYTKFAVTAFVPVSIVLPCRLSIGARLHRSSVAPRPTLCCGTQLGPQVRERRLRPQPKSISWDCIKPVRNICRREVVACSADKDKGVLVHRGVGDSEDRIQERDSPDEMQRVPLPTAEPSVPDCQPDMSVGRDGEAVTWRVRGRYAERAERVLRKAEKQQSMAFVGNDMDANLPDPVDAEDDQEGDGQRRGAWEGDDGDGSYPDMTLLLNTLSHLVKFDWAKDVYASDPRFFQLLHSCGRGSMMWRVRTCMRILTTAPPSTKRFAKAFQDACVLISVVPDIDRRLRRIAKMTLEDAIHDYVFAALFPDAYWGAASNQPNPPLGPPLPTNSTPDHTAPHSRRPRRRPDRVVFDKMYDEHDMAIVEALCLRVGWVGLRQPLSAKDCASMIGISVERMRALQIRFEQQLKPTRVYLPQLDRALRQLVAMAPCGAVLAASALQEAHISKAPFHPSSLALVANAFGRAHDLRVVVAPLGARGAPDVEMVLPSSNLVAHMACVLAALYQGKATCVSCVSKVIDEVAYSEGITPAPAQVRQTLRAFAFASNGMVLVEERALWQHLRTATSLQPTSLNNYPTPSSPPPSPSSLHNHDPASAAVLGRGGGGGSTSDDKETFEWFCMFQFDVPSQRTNIFNIARAVLIIANHLPIESVRAAIEREVSQRCARDARKRRSFLVYPPRAVLRYLLHIHPDFVLDQLNDTVALAHHVDAKHLLHAAEQVIVRAFRVSRGAPMQRHAIIDIARRFHTQDGRRGYISPDTLNQVISYSPILEYDALTRTYTIRGNPPLDPLPGAEELSTARGRGSGALSRPLRGSLVDWQLSHEARSLLCLYRLPRVRRWYGLTRDTLHIEFKLPRRKAVRDAFHGPKFAVSMDDIVSVVSKATSQDAEGGAYWPGDVHIDEAGCIQGACLQRYVWDNIYDPAAWKPGLNAPHPDDFLLMITLRHDKDATRASFVLVDSMSDEGGPAPTAAPSAR